MPTAEHLILRELLARDPDWVSGSALATKLGVSRVAIWHHMEKLRAAGNPVETRTFTGVVHGFLRATGDVQKARDAVAAAGAWMRRVG